VQQLAALVRVPERPRARAEEDAGHGGPVGAGQQRVGIHGPGEGSGALLGRGPGARTFWHSHERGQLLHVVSGCGLVCSEGGTARPLDPGDLVWVSPGERHWHGGGPETALLHLAVSLGATSWLRPVSDAEYGGGQPEPPGNG
jgi:quercetin dioxygenase-like cupin family protein